jgi:hypothetical protein
LALEKINRETHFPFHSPLSQKSEAGVTFFGKQSAGGRMGAWLLLLLILTLGGVRGQVRFGDEPLALEDDYYYETGEELGLGVSEKDRLRDCGKQDTCPADPDFEKLGQASGNYAGRDKVDADFKANPFTCHCDLATCAEYGDCCPTLLPAIGGMTRAKTNPWRCHPLNPHQRTVSTSPSPSTAL